ncbi:MAG TPA: 1,4-alpha-glucan branching enzyme, partial [Pseudolysinimonas sp.]|nr:1,4-alpha-glucan branching enzyme [Pseudolysinimonas sp.]
MAVRKKPLPELPELPGLDPGLVSSLVAASHARPHDWLGAHAVPDGWVIRAVRPLAKTVTAIRADGTRIQLIHLADGLWQGFAPGDGQAYELQATYDGAPDWVTGD